MKDSLPKLGVNGMGSLEGQQLGPYRVIAQMGHGGMATVYKAHHPRLDRYVAIKMMHQAFLEDKNFLARFEREAQIVARLEHPHIVPVYDFADFEGRPYLVMKHIEGGTLKSVLEKRALTLDEVLRILPPVADALDYAHGQGVLHRDIKPSNIIIDASGVPYLTDFGLARIAQIGESTLSQDVLLGTPHYISPEQAMGSREIDSRTDIYSLGVVLYELVVGRVPFSADTPFAIVHDHIYRPLPSPREINPELTPEVAAVLEKALAKNPADRYASASELVEAFKSAVEKSNLKQLAPNRAKAAEQSLIKHRRQQDQDETTVDAPVSKPKRSQPSEESPTGTRRVVEHSFDFSNIGRVFEEAGRAIEDVGESFSGDANADIAPYEDDESIRHRVEKQFKKRSEFVGHIVAYAMVNALLWILYMSTSGLDFLSDIQQAMAFPWPIIVMFGWGSGLLAHAIEMYYATGKREERRYQAVRRELYNTFGEDWSRVDKRELRKVRRRAEQPMKKRAEFLQHLAVYVMINLMLWFIFFSSGDLPAGLNDLVQAFPWPLIVMFGWGIGLVSHWIDTMTTLNRERAIARAVERERERLWGEKPKNDFADDDIDARSVRLTEDGELTDSTIQQWERDDKPKRSRR